MMSDIYLEKKLVCLPQYGLQFYVFIILLTFQSTTDAVTLIGSADYAIPGSDFTLTCDVPEEANIVTFYRRPELSTTVGSIQVAGGQCYNTKLNPPDVCDPGVCSCVPTSTGGGGTVFRWVIQPQSGDQGSVWFCRRTHLGLPSPSQDSLDFTLNVAAGPGASIRLSPSDTSYTRTEGDMLPDITCTADCRPGCTFVWTKPDNTNFTASAVLSLGRLERSEHGTYRCTAKNTVGESSITISVDVQYGPGTSTALSPPETSYTRTEGETLPEIICTADCRPGCTFVWTKPDNTSLPVSAVLSLGQLDRSEQGTYICTARNEVGVSTTTPSVTISLKYGPGTSTALSPPQTSYTRTEGDTLPDITCTADCRPGCTFAWTKPDNTNLSVSAVLSLGRLDRSEHGTYRCTARNEVGMSTTTPSVTISLQYGPGTSTTLSPPETSYTRNEGVMLPDITCTADCRPGCTFVWTKPDNTNFTASAVLSLGQLDKSEHGTYRCTARNYFGESVAATDVIVQYGPGNSVALFPPDTTYTRTERDTLPDITCTADCRPGCTFVWTKPDNTNFTASAVLSLGQLGRSDHGTYRCTARNVVGESTIAASVTVLYGPGTSVVLSPPVTTYSITEGDMLPDITCTADCRPDCTFVWTKPDNTNFTVSPVLSLGQLDRSEHGTYRCTARNGIGESTITASVTVQYAGKPQQPLTLVISQLTSRSVVLSWEPGNEQETFETFRLTYQKHNDLSTTYVILNKTTTTFLIERLLPSTQYDVSVFAVNAEGRSEALTGAFVTRESQIIGDESENTGDTGVVLISVGSVMILLGLLVFAVAIFMIRKGRLPYGRQNTTDKRSSTNKPHSSKDIGGVGQGERYEDLNLEQIEPPSEYDEVSNNQPDNGNTTTGNTRNVYEYLQRQSTANTYEDIPPKPGSGSDGMYVNAAPN